MKKVIFGQFLSFLIVLSMVLSFSVTAAAAEPLKLGKADESENMPFQVANMFPGDAVSKDFVVKVKHSKALTLYYHADIQPGYEKLAEVLMVKIELPEKGIQLYDGLMRGMPSALEHELKAGEGEVLYRITAYLDTGVGNDYQNKTLKADFRWWYLEEEAGGSADEDPDDSWGGSSGGHRKDYVNVKLIAEKYMDGKKATGSAFRFELLESDGDLLQSRKNSNERIEFRSLHLTSKGEYTYSLKEVKGSDDKVIYDESTYEVTVKVLRDEDGDLCAKVSYEKDGEAYEGIPRFYNKTVKTPVDTSDNMPLELYGGAFLLCLALFLFLLLKGKKKEDESHE